MTTLAAAIALSTAFAGTAVAQPVITGDSSDWSKVDIGLSTVSAGTIHVKDRVGIGVPNTGLTTRIDFEGLKAILGNNEVTTFTATTTDVDDHSTYGRFDFVQAGSHDVWFGEWSQTGDATAGDHTVYYGGTDASTFLDALAQSGSASYSVKGISNYASNGLLEGTFNASFDGMAGGTIGGSLTNGTYTVDIGSGTLTGATFASSTATAESGSTTLASGGAVTGQFYGSNLDALAGLVQFGDGSTAVRQYDTAFGGTRD